MFTAALSVCLSIALSLSLSLSLSLYVCVFVCSLIRAARSRRAEEEQIATSSADVSEVSLR